MHHTQAFQVEIEQQRLEPGDVFARQLAALPDLLQAGLMLPSVLVAMRAQMLAGLVRVRRRPGHSIELMAAHHGDRRACVNHCACDPHRLDLVWAAVDEVAEEYHLALLRVWPDAAVLPMAEGIEQSLQRFGMAVNIADQVIHAGLLCRMLVVPTRYCGYISGLCHQRTRARVSLT
jgi:hypothetical protein